MDMGVPVCHSTEGLGHQDTSGKDITATQTVTQSATQSATQLSDPVERLLMILEQGEQSSGELRELLQIKHRPTFRKNYLHPAMESGLIEYTIPLKPNTYEATLCQGVKYITDSMC